jgi:natural product precursor
MKKTKEIKTIKAFEAVKLTKEQMYMAKGGEDCTCGTKSVCHVDGTDDNDDAQ